MGKYTTKMIDTLLTQYQLNASEEANLRLPITVRTDLYNSVAAGDFEAVLSHPFMNVTMDYVRTIDADGPKMMEYSAVIMINYCMEAAMKGGLSLQMATDITDTLHHALAHASGNIEDVIEIFKIAPVFFARKVHENQVSNSYLIERIRQYVAKNIFQKIMLNDIAAHVSLNPSYVSKTFSEFTGMTLHNYIQKTKIESSCNMLIYSNLPISAIAQYYSFQSQSNYTAIFKKWIGISPTAYRNQNAQPDFFSPN